MLDQLPDVVLIYFFNQFSHKDRLCLEIVCHRFNELMKEVWNKKQSIIFPYDIWQVNRRYPVSSYLDDFRGPTMSILVDHCPNIRAIRFENYKHLQVMMQDSCMTHFERYQSLNLFIKEIFIDSKYVTDIDMIREMARVFPNLEKLSILHPFPLLHKMRSDTMNVLRMRISNLEPQLWPLIDDNQRVIEDIRLLLELFSSLKVLRMKDANFNVVALEEA